MADKRIADFATLEEAQDDDLLLISSEDEAYNMKFSVLRAYLQSLAGLVKETRTINGKALSSDIELQAPDIRYQGGLGAVKLHTVGDAIDAIIEELSKAPQASSIVLRVNVARAANGTFTADKTFAEIKAAYDAGSAVEAAYTDNNAQNRCILPLTYCTTNTCIFSAYLATEEQGWELVQLSCTNAGKWADFSGSIPAEDVQYQGNIGAAQVFSAAQALDGLAIGVPLDMSSDYAGSGAASVQAWAAMAATGDATKYRIAAGRYQINSDAYTYNVVITNVPSSTARIVQITECSNDPFVYLSVYSAASPGAAPVEQVYFSSEEHLFSIYGKNVILPDYTSADNDKVLTIKNGYPKWGTVPALPAVSAADNGKFLRVVSGAWAAQALTNVAEVGA